MKYLQIATVLVLTLSAAVRCPAQDYALEYEYPVTMVDLLNDDDHFVTPEHYDLEGDGRAEIVMIDSSGSPESWILLVVDGSTHEVEWTYERDESFYFAGFADLDGDQDREALIRIDNYEQEGATEIVDVATGETVASLPYGYETVTYDYDQDGLPEIQIDSETGVQIWGWQENIAATDAASAASALLMQNHPNPFNPRTTIRYQVQAAGEVKLDVFDVRGLRIRRLVSETLSPGDYDAVWDGTDEAGQHVASGSYFYQLSVGDFTASRKLLLLK